MSKTEIHINRKFIERLQKEPQEVIDVYNLTYTTPPILSIQRIIEKKKFDYLHNGRALRDRHELKRIKNLVIPPAWSNVRIAHLENAHLQAVGRDLKNRKQYKYHSKWIKLKNETKFYKMLSFAKALPKIRAQVAKDLEQTNWSKSKVLALVLSLLEESHIRIGNSYYAKRNKTYGLTTLRTKHVSIFKDKIKFNFIGKKGKEHDITIRNKKLAQLVNKCEEIPGWELFQYFDSDGTKRAIDSSMVNEYIHDASGDIFSAKDFRTWAASLIVFDTLKSMKAATTKKTREKQLLKAIDAASKELNNSRNVCRKYYVHPHIIDSHLNGTIRQFLHLADTKIVRNEIGLQPNELALKALIQTYKPQFNI